MEKGPDKLMINKVNQTHCYSCGRFFDGKTKEAHEYQCPACEVVICEECHNSRSIHRENPKPDESNCEGVFCPKCADNSKEDDPEIVLHFFEL